jgi:ferrous iron transport protein A
MYKMQIIKENNQNMLSELPIGEIAKVTTISGDTAIAKRLMEMGVVPGVSVKMVNTAPFGCPLEISLRGYHLAIRRSEAETIGIKK